MLKTYLPWLLSAITIYMTVLAGNRNRWAWAIGLLNQALWLTWIVASSAWGLLPMNIALWVVYARNHFKWTAAAPAHAAGQVPAWQPIETAPRDGTEIVLSNGVTVAEGHWLHAEPYIRERRDLDGRYIDQDESDGFDGWIDWSGGMQPEPTHWQPLPAAPAHAGERPPSL